MSINLTDSPIVISTFYHFSRVEDPLALKPALLARMREYSIHGTITLAHEGINATIAGTKEAVEAIITYLRALPAFSDLKHRISVDSKVPFGNCRVKVKRELIGLGTPTDPTACVGEYIAPKNWNALITREDVITIDTRNDYEFQIGHFKGAINPGTRSYNQMIAFTSATLDPHRHRHIAMYCTGGIRCEKYSSYLVKMGFKHVYHLRGGILAYLETIAPEESLWHGECYVFDARVAVGHGLRPSTDCTMCFGCGMPLRHADRQHAAYIPGKQCGGCYAIKAAKRAA